MNSSNNLLSFGQMHILVIFLVLGVGADDVFVFADKWNATNPKESTEQRLVETINHTMRAVFNTSFTTIFAFVATAISPIMPISAFGIYAAVIIGINYIFCMTLTPCLMVIHQQRFAGKSYKEIVMGRCAVSAPFDEANIDDKEFTKEGVSLSLDDAGSKGIPKFFHHTMAPVLNLKHNGVKFISITIVLIGFLWFIATLNSAILLTPPQKPNQTFKDGHMFTGISEYTKDNYAAGDSDKYMLMAFVLGIVDIDRSEYNQWEPAKNRGSAVYNRTLHDSLSTVKGQRDFIQVCEIVRSAPCSLEACKQGPQSEPSKLVYSNESVLCFMENYIDWVSGNGNLTDDTLPEQEAFVLKLLEFLKTDQGQPFASYVGFDNSTAVPRIQLATIPVLY